MPAEVPNPYPFITAEEIEALRSTVSREQLAARLIAVRGFGPTIPATAFLRGASDHSPMMKGIVELVTLCYQVLDAWHGPDGLPVDGYQQKLDTLLPDLSDMLTKPKEHLAP